MSEVRDAIEAAVEKHEGDSEKDTFDVSAREKPATPEPPAPEREEPAPSEPTDKPAPEPKSAKPSAPPPSDKGQQVSENQQPGQVKAKAPVSWRPEVREHWTKLDPSVQQEVMRREREVTDTLRQTTDARRFHTDFMQMAQPFMGFIAAEGSNPIQAANNMFQTAALLRVGSPQQKADVIANIVKSFSIDVGMLDQALARALGVAGGEQGGQRAVDPAFQQLQQQFAPVIDYVNQLRSRETQIVQSTETRLGESLEAFMNDEANEFVHDVREDMADVLDMAAKRGTPMSLQDAYNRAILLHPTISKVVEQRKMASSLSGQSAAAQQARARAVSVSSSGAPSNSSTRDPGSSVRSAIEAAFEVHENRTR